jgi:hypothetical protein
LFLLLHIWLTVADFAAQRWTAHNRPLQKTLQAFFPSCLEFPHNHRKATLSTAQRFGLNLRILAYSITSLDVTEDGRDNDRTAGN